MKSVNINEIKNKFGRLLSYAALQNGMSVDLINEQIIQNLYFDFLENDEINRFLLDDLSDISFKAFNVRGKKYSELFLNDYVFAGNSYISISISLSIPLRKLFLLFPLKEMIALFPVYHEMSPYSVIEKVKEEISHKSAFGIIVKRSELSVHIIAKATGINRNFLQSLVYDSSLENKLTIDNVVKITKLLNVDKVFITKSNFSGYYSSIWNNAIFVKIFKEKLYSISRSNKFPIYFEDVNKENIKESLFLYLTTHSAVFYSSNKVVAKIADNLFDFVLLSAIDAYKGYCLSNRLAYC